MIDESASSLSDAKRSLLQHRLRGAGAGIQPVARPIRHGHQQPAPLSVVQEQLWYFSVLAPESPVYNEAVAIRKRGEFQPDAFRSAFRALVRRHDIWRSTFQVIDDEPRQIVSAAAEYELPLHDLTALPIEEAEREAVRMAAALASQPYDLARGPLLRPLLVRLAADDHRLYLAIHHLLFDGGSLSQTVLPELVALYDAHVLGTEPELLMDPPQYAEYAAWEREWVRSPQFAARLDHWKHRLAGAPTLDLPLDHPRPALQQFRGGTEPVSISAELAHGLRLLARRSGATLFQTMAATFAVLLERTCGQDDVVFGTVADLRQRVEHEHVVGYCVTPLVLRIDLADDPTFTDVVGRVRNELIDALDNKVPFGRLVRELHPRRGPGANPICQALFVLEPAGRHHDSGWDLDLTVIELDDAIAHAKFDLTVELDERAGGDIAGRLIFNSDILERRTVRRLVDQWTRLLEGAVTHPDQAISRLPLMTDADRQRLLFEWNDTGVDREQSVSLHGAVAAQALRTPDAVAVTRGQDAVTFAQLDDRAGRLARHLREMGVGPDVLVGVCLERSIDLVVSLLAVLKAGGAYLPLEPDHPRERLALILADACPAVILTGAGPPDLAPGAARVFNVEAERESWMALAPARGAASAGTDLAYVLYTSGSTGAPKGVMVEHRAIVNQLLWRVDSFALTPADRVLQKTPIGFDVSVWELFCPLISGSTMVMLEPRAHIDPRMVDAAIREDRITAVHFVPSMLEELVGSGSAGPYETLRLVATSGEALSADLARRFFERCGTAVELRNLYGPTEAAVDVTSWVCEPGATGPVPIGRPVANTQIYLLDARHQPVPVGSAGELWIGGMQVARGYLNSPELTAQAFIDNPFVVGDRIYRTGDLARYRDDGTLDYLGRNDQQVKIRGNRVELGEIEAALTAHAPLGSAAVIAIDAGDGETSLVAYVTARGGEPIPSAAALRAGLSDRLPAPMLPSAVVVLDRMPMTPSGKVDRNALLRLGWQRQPAEIRNAPRSATEERLASIWARVLRLDRVDVDAGFFDLGGHSLLAARMLTEVEREMGVAVPLAAVIENDFTVAGMAAIIGESSLVDRSSTPLAPGRDSGYPPLFFFHSDESTMFTLRHFMGPLGDNQRVVGLLPERVGRRFNRNSSVEELTQPLVATIRAAQPRGPYYLAGFSLGALLAYEAAGRLEMAGEEVMWLGNLDCETPEVARRLMWLRSPRGFFRRLAERGPRRAVLKVARLVRSAVRAPLVALSLLPAQLTDDFDVAGARAIGVKYEVKGNRVPMELFVSADVVDMSGEPSLGWERVHHGAMTVHPIPGTHLSMLTEPHVKVVADIVSDSLRRAQLARVPQLS